MHPRCKQPLHVQHSRSHNPLHPLPFAIKTKNRKEWKYTKQARTNERARLIYPSTFYFHLHSREVVGQSTYCAAPAPHWPVWIENIFSKMEQKPRVGNSAFCFLRVAFLIGVKEFAESGRLMILITLEHSRCHYSLKGSCAFHLLHCYFITMALGLRRDYRTSKLALFVPANDRPVFAMLFARNCALVKRLFARKQWDATRVFIHKPLLALLDSIGYSYDIKYFAFLTNCVRPGWHFQPWLK